MTDAYSPFSLADDPDYPLRLSIDYPEHVANWRPLVQWLFAIPYCGWPGFCTGSRAS
jgi:hypothetical protein